MFFMSLNEPNLALENLSNEKIFGLDKRADATQAGRGEINQEINQSRNP